jgi:hypothetical protein
MAEADGIEILMDAINGGRIAFGRSFPRAKDDP